MLKVTLVIASLLNQAEARADEWTTTGKIISDSWWGTGIAYYRSTSPQYFVTDYVGKSEYDTNEMKYGAINWMKICRDSFDYKLEWKYQNMCDESDFSTKHCVGDCSAAYSTTSCNEFSVKDGECINNLSLYASQSSGIEALGFETTDGTEDVLHEYQNSTSSSYYYSVSYTQSFFENSYTEYKVPMTNSTTTRNEELVCLTALEPEMYQYYSTSKPMILNYKVSYNPETPYYNSTQCEEYRNQSTLVYSGGSAGGIVGAVLGICCCGGIALAIWFFFIRRTGSAGSLNADNQKPSTPEAAPQQTTTTIIQQQPAMMMQPQPVMMQQQPMMMQQPGMMPMQQPGMMPMQQPGMVPMQQPGMMQMQQPGMQQQVVYQ